LQAWVHAADAAERARCGLPTRAKKKETTMSQMTSFVKAEKAAEKASVLVAMAVVTARKAQAPTGSGSSTSPAMVLTKMESRVQACTLMPAGMGTRKRSARPSPTAAKNGTGLAPCGGGVQAAAERCQKRIHDWQRLFCLITRVSYRPGGRRRRGGSRG
jgi:hypothetical protein